MNGKQADPSTTATVPDSKSTDPFYISTRSVSNTSRQQVTASKTDSAIHEKTTSRRSRILQPPAITGNRQSDYHPRPSSPNISLNRIGDVNVRPIDRQRPGNRSNDNNGAETRNKGDTDSRTRPALQLTVRSFNPALQLTVRSFNPALQLTVGSFNPALQLTVGSINPALQLTVRSINPAHPVTARSINPAPQLTARSSNPALLLTAAVLTANDR